MRAPLRITFTGNRMQALVSGNGARLLLLELRGRLPVWSKKGRGYTVTEATASDVLAAAESRAWLVVVNGSPESVKRPTVDVAPVPAPEAEDVPLW